MSVVVDQPISHRIDHMLSGTHATIAVKIFGPDLYELRRIGERIKTEAPAVRGAVDVALEQQADIPMVLVRLWREAIARYDLTMRDISEAVEAALGRVTVSRVLGSEASFDLVVRSICWFARRSRRCARRSLRPPAVRNSRSPHW